MKSAAWLKTGWKCGCWHQHLISWRVKERKCRVMKLQAPAPFSFWLQQVDDRHHSEYKDGWTIWHYDHRIYLNMHVFGLEETCKLNPQWHWEGPEVEPGTFMQGDSVNHSATVYRSSVIFVLVCFGFLKVWSQAFSQRSSHITAEVSWLVTDKKPCFI